MAEAFPKRLAIAQAQTEQLRALMAAVVPANPFQTKRLDAAEVSRRISNLNQFISKMNLFTPDLNQFTQRG